MGKKQTSSDIFKCPFIGWSSWNATGDGRFTKDDVTVFVPKDGLMFSETIWPFVCEVCYRVYATAKGGNVPEARKAFHNHLQQMKDAKTT